MECARRQQKLIKTICNACFTCFSLFALDFFMIAACKQARNFYGTATDAKKSKAKTATNHK